WRALGERRVRQDLDAAVGFLDAAQLGDTSEIDDHGRPLDSILQPVERVEPTGHDPGAFMALKQSHGIGDRGWLEQLERRHYVANDRHRPSSLDIGREALVSGAPLLK